MFAVLITALLCLVSVAHSDPASCESLVQPLDQVDPQQFGGQLAFIAGSLSNSRVEEEVKGRDSITIYYYDSSYTMVIRKEGNCGYHQRNVTIENNLLKSQAGNYNFTGTFYRTSCPDCVLMTMTIDSDHFNAVEFYLIGKNRTVEEEVLEEFKSQAECLKLRAPIFMDQTKELCPEQPASQPDANEA